MDYYITSNGELRHAAPNRGWEKEDHKYIKREWKNGRWQYTYKQDAKASKKSFQKWEGTRDLFKPAEFKTDSRNTRTKTVDTDKWLSSTTTIKNLQGGKVTTTTINNRGKIDRAIDKAKDALGKYAEERKKDWAESKERADKKAKDDAAKRGVDVKNTDKLGSSVTTITIGNSKFVTENRGKFEQYVETAKEYVKDRLGFDEKEVYDGAKSQELLTGLKKAAAQADIETNAKLDNSLADKSIAEAAKALVKYDEQLKRDAENVEKAEKEYAKTIAGKVDLWLEELMGRRR